MKMKCELCLRRRAIVEIDRIHVCENCAIKLLKEKPEVSQGEKWLKSWLKYASKLEDI